MKQSIGRYKYHNKREYADFYVEELLKRYKEQILKWNPDVLIPIPLYKEKKKKRGYNQAELIAKGIGIQLQIRVVTDYLERCKNTAPQKGLNEKQRVSNLKEAFVIQEKKKKKYVPLKHVLLIDDIYTTGSTIETCTNVLLKAGVEKVHFISICIGAGL